MSIKRVSPTSFVAGTVVPSDWFTTVSSGFNAGWFGSAAIADDFTGSTLNTGVWLSTGSIANTVGPDANGVITITQSVAGSSNIYTQQYKRLGTADFYVSFRANVALYGAGTTIKMGLWNSGTASDDVYFYADGTANWKCMNNVTTLATSSVAVTATGQHLFEISRSSGLLVFSIDGVTIYSGTFNTNIAGGPQVKADVTYTSTTGEIVLDRVRAYFDVT